MPVISDRPRSILPMQAAQDMPGTESVMLGSAASASLRAAGATLQAAQAEVTSAP